MRRSLRSGILSWRHLSAGAIDEDVYAGIIEIHLGGVPRGQRRQRLREVVDGLATPTRGRPLPATGPPSLLPPSTAVLDDVLDLSWLASPVSAIRHVLSLGSDEGARGVLDHLAGARVTRGRALRRA